MESDASPVKDEKPQYVAVPLEEYAELLEDQKFLIALQTAGVDNWEWYDEAVELYNEMNKEILH